MLRGKKIPIQLTGELIWKGIYDSYATKGKEKRKGREKRVDSSADDRCRGIHGGNCFMSIDYNG